MLNYRLLIPSIMLALAATPVMAQTPPPATAPEVLSKEAKAEVLLKVEEIVTKSAFVPGVELSKWPEFLAKQREAIDAAEKESDFSRAVNVALRDFGISHIRFLAPRTAQARVRTSTIGVGLSGRPVDEGLSVTRVFAKSPADEAGIKVGDIILLVDGKRPEGVTVLEGEEGTDVAVQIKAKDAEPRELKLVRKPYSTLREDTLTWQGDTAILKIHSFSRGYERATIEKHLTDAAKAKYLLLDLRSNGGGATTNLQHLLSLLLPPDTTIGTFVSRASADEYAKKMGKPEADPVLIAAETTRKYKTRKGKVAPFAGKIAVLINRGSASASEIAAAALHENLGSPVVGVRSAGAVLASVFRKLPHGYEIQYPIMDYVTAKGRRLEKNPLTPDLEVTARQEEGQADPVIAKAIESLQTSGQ